MTTRPLIVFDLDGTLVDSRRDLTESVNEMLATYGAEPLAVDAVTSMVGEGARVLVSRAIRAVGGTIDAHEALARFLAIYDERLLNHTRPYDGIDAVVREAARRAAVCVLTNKPEPPTRRLLDAFDLTPSLTAIIGGDSGYPRKPDPAGLQHLMQIAPATPDQTMVVGDSEVDVETARRGGVAICVARYGFGGAVGTTGATSAATPADVGRAVAAFIDRVGGSSAGVESGVRSQGASS
jgi:phosphoglycolate phosphatase